MVVDSHVLLWWMEGHPALSEKARTLLDSAEQQRSSFYVCSVTFWELRMKELRGLLKPSRSLPEWPAILHQLPWLVIEPTSVDIWLASAGLDWAHRDPADRILAATALRYHIPVLSKDRVFHQSDSPVEAVW